MKFELSIGKRSLRIQTGIHAAPPAPPARPPAANGGQRMFASAQTNRLTQDWGVSITSADAEILTSAIATRSRLRAGERDDDYMRGMFWLIENNVIGDHGIRLRLKTRGADGKLDRVVNAAVEDAWHEYLEEPNCTVMRNRHGTEIQRLAMRSLARDGVILFRKHRAFGNDFGYAIEPLEVDRLDHWWNRPAVGSANEIRFGIEFDRFNAPVAYWILTRHPGDVFAYSTSARYRERVPADEIIPLWTIERAGQSIGMPLWCSIVKRLHNLYGYEESEQIAARVASAKGGWFEVDPAAAGQDEYVGPEDSQGNKLVNTEPGQWEQLPVGWRAKENKPEHPTEAFPHFVKSQLRGAAAGGGLPYNSVAQDLESVNYSSYKAGMNDARDGFKFLQQLITLKLMRPWFRDWLPYAIMSGKIKLPMSELDRLRKADLWKPRRWAGLEPLKEAQAHVIKIEAGLDSKRNIIEEDYDRDIEDVFDEQEHDNELAKEHNLIFESIEKPVVGAGGGSNVDTETGRSSGHNGNGHSNGNGNGKVIPELLRELRAQRYDFRELAKKQNVPIVTVENARPQPTSKRTIRLFRGEDGRIDKAEVDGSEE